MTTTILYEEKTKSNVKNNKLEIWCYDKWACHPFCINHFDFANAYRFAFLLPLPPPFSWYYFVSLFRHHKTLFLYKIVKELTTARWCGPLSLNLYVCFEYQYYIIVITNRHKLNVWVFVCLPMCDLLNHFQFFSSIHVISQFFSNDFIVGEGGGGGGGIDKIFFSFVVVKKFVD